MSLIRQFKQFRLWLEHGSELAVLRLHMLKIDLTEQALSWVKMVAALAVCGVCLLTAFISLLFGLNTVLTPEAKLWVFFGIFGTFSLLAGLMLWLVWRLWRMQGHFTHDTFQQIAGDLKRLRTPSPASRSQTGAPHETL